MRALARRVAYAPALASTALLAACSGTSAGKVDPNAGTDAANKIGDFIINNGKAVATVLLILAVGGFVRWLSKIKGIQILFALAAGGTVVYFATRGHR